MAKKTTTKARASKIPKPKRSARPCPQLRVTVGGLVLGPGKIDLIEAIDRTGSISAAGRDMGMSYRRAWLLADTLNRMFHEPVIKPAVGGVRGGGAQLTEFGRRLAAAYRRAEERTRLAVEQELASLDPAFRRR